MKLNRDGGRAPDNVDDDDDDGSVGHLAIFGGKSPMAEITWAASEAEVLCEGEVIPRQLPQAVTT